MTTTLTARLAPLLPTRLVAAAARAVYPRFEPELARLTDLLPPDCGTAVDVGGWYGPWTHRLWRHARQVVTVEPVPHLAGLLAAAAPAHARVIPAAASDRPGTARLWLPPDDEGDRGVSSLVRRDIHARAVHVRCVTLDGLGLKDVGFIKIDVDGSELAVLHGATGLLARDRPALFVELESRIQPIAPVVTYLSLLGYEGWVLPDRNRDWVRLSAFPLEEHQARTSYVVSQGLLRRVLPFSRGPRYVNSVLFLPAGRSPGGRGPDVSAVRDDGSHARRETPREPLQPPRLPTRPAAPHGGPQPGPGRGRPS
ncbi:FkbM family methyltransferase [Streptomyces hokutonensis]|uniref:FkbM family methyltransferase n=1 Tax=Streptomyces hokutonensis TaxID=1306990 RepID=UPI000378B052|nr:FkbM family methyltransferase [Streptomyces hokutonensis]